jgi:hypothetical protein
MEDMVKKKRQTLNDNQVLEELEGWVKDLVFSRTHDIKFFRISETY